MASHDSDDSFPWEDEVRELLSDALSHATVHEDARAVQIRIDGVYEDFADLDSLRDLLVDRAEDELMSRAPEDGADYSDASAIVDEVIADSGLEAYFDELSPKPDKTQLLLNFEGLLSETAESRVRIDLGLINTELIKHLASHPEKMHVRRQVLCSSYAERCPKGQLLHRGVVQPQSCYGASALTAETATTSRRRGIHSRTTAAVVEEEP